MKKLSLVVLLGAVAWVLPCGSASATPLFLDKFKAKYGDNADLQSAVTEAKCNVCHVKGAKSKKDRNPYGETLHKLGLEKDNYPKTRVDAEGAQVEKELFEFFEKAAAEKSAEGKAFGEIIGSGKLPVEQ